MDGIDWLAVCRRIVDAQREIFARYASSGERTAYEGIGSGGDRTLVIDRLCEDAAFAELEALVEATGQVLRVVSEERGEVDLGAAGGEPDRWIVIDPIDGSLNARRTIPRYSFCLAVAEGPTMPDVEFGFVHDFGTDEEFTARRGQGAWLNGSELEPLTHGDEVAELEVVGLESADPDLVGPAMDVLIGHAHRLRVVGSIAITLCQVACGRFDGMFSLRPCRSVDVAAAQLVAREVGAHVDLGPDGVNGVGFALDDRFPIRAARTVAGVGLLRQAQELSPAFSEDR